MYHIRTMKIEKGSSFYSSFNEASCAKIVLEMLIPNLFFRIASDAKAIVLN